MSIKITGPKAITLPASLDGDDQIYGLVVVSSTRGLKVRDHGDGTVDLEGITDTELLSTSVVALLLSKGCEVFNYPVFFEIDDPNAPIPESFPNRTFEKLVDPDDPESGTTTEIHTWSTWGADTRPDLRPQDIDGTLYRSSQNPYDGGAPIAASAWSGAGLTVLSTDEYAELTVPAEV